MRKKRKTITADHIRSINSLMEHKMSRREISTILDISETAAKKYYLIISVLKNPNKEDLNRVVSVYFDNLNGATKTFNWMCDILNIPHMPKEMFEVDVPEVKEEQLILADYEDSSLADEIKSMSKTLETVSADVKNIGDRIDGVVAAMVSLYKNAFFEKEGM